MTPERAQEIIDEGCQWNDFEKHMSVTEIQEVGKVRESMPGHTCWFDALCRIKNGEVDPLDQEILSKDIKTLERYKNRRGISITDEGNVYEVYHRWKFLDAQRHTIEDALFLLQARVKK